MELEKQEANFTVFTVAKREKFFLESITAALSNVFRERVLQKQILTSAISNMHWENDRRACFIRWYQKEKQMPGLKNNKNPNISIDQESSHDIIGKARLRENLPYMYFLQYKITK